MLCCICKEREATVHLTQIAGEKVQKVDLCEQCAKAKGVDNPTSFAFADMVLGLGASHEMEKAAGSKEQACPVCGFTQADFKKTGRLGCPDCYSHFGEGLETLLKTMHKGLRHTGKVPKRLGKVLDVSDRLKTLQHELNKAIEGEKFERAAELRDEIRSIATQTKDVETGL